MASQTLNDLRYAYYASALGISLTAAMNQSENDLEYKALSIGALTGGGGGSPTGVAGGSLAGAYPNPTLNPLAVADLNVFTSTLKGIVPASGGGTANFLRADGTWQLVPTLTPGTGISIPPPVGGVSTISVDSSVLTQVAPVVTSGGIQVTGPSVFTGITLSQPIIILVAPAALGSSSIFDLQRGAATDAPGGVNAPSIIGSFRYRGSNGVAAGFNTAATIAAAAEETFDSTHAGSNMRFSVSLTATTTPSERLRIGMDGHLHTNTNASLAIGGGVVSTPLWLTHIMGGNAANSGVGIDTSTTGPTIPASNASCVMSVYKGATNWYLMFTFNEAGTTRYRYMQLNGSTTPAVWTTATTLPV